MTNCILKTEYDSQPVDAKNTGDGTSETWIPDHAIGRFAKFLYPRFLADMEQRNKAKE
jgi:hypothetical protein